MRRHILAALLLLSFAAFPARADDVLAAVAANMTEPAREIAAAFERKTGHTVRLSFGASGNFNAQIRQGAPYQVFISADVERPRALEKDGFAIGGTRFTYARGRLVLWSTTPRLIQGRPDVLRINGFSHIAIADPAAAPYGEAAVETLKALGVYETLAPNIVRGASIAQTFTFVQSGSAQLGFVALSQIQNPGGLGKVKGAQDYWLVPQNLHSPIDQQAVLIKDTPAARAFLGFLKGPEAQTILRAYGYEIP